MHETEAVDRHDDHDMNYKETNKLKTAIYDNSVRQHRNGLHQSWGHPVSFKS